MTAVETVLERRWRALAAEAGWPALPAGRVYAALIAAWSQPHRRYHDLRHLERCLALFERYRELLERPVPSALALWHHDCVYDPRAGDNEERSVEVAEDHARLLGLDEAGREHVRRCILATRHGEEPPPRGDAALVADIDLAILGADPATFDAYERDVRAEYAFVPWERYRTARRRVLERLAAGDGPFRHEALRRDLGAAARRNLRRALARLEGEPGR